MKEFEETRNDALERYGIDTQYPCCLNCVWFTDRCTNEGDCEAGQFLWGLSLWEGR